jgi:hypothetical protein
MLSITPELTKEIIVGCVAAIATAIFTGVPAALLVWWSWQRDQERLVVQKLIPNSQTVTGEWVAERDGFGPVFGILIRNRSLYPVHLSEMGFEIDGTAIALEHPSFESRMIRNPVANTNRPYVADEEYDPREVPSQSSRQVSVFNPADRAKLTSALAATARRYNSSVEKILTSPRVVVLVALETGKIFRSDPFLRRAWRKLLDIKKEIDEA